MVVIYYNTFSFMTNDNKINFLTISSTTVDSGVYYNSYAIIPICSFKCLNFKLISCTNL